MPCLNMFYLESILTLVYCAAVKKALSEKGWFCMPTKKGNKSSPVYVFYGEEALFERYKAKHEDKTTDDVDWDNATPRSTSGNPFQLRPGTKYTACDLYNEDSKQWDKTIDITWPKVGSPSPLPAPRPSASSFRFINNHASFSAGSRGSGRRRRSGGRLRLRTQLRQGKHLRMFLARCDGPRLLLTVPVVTGRFFNPALSYFRLLQEHVPSSSTPPLYPSRTTGVSICTTPVATGFYL